MVLTLAVFTGATALLISGVHDQSAVQGRASPVQQAQGAMTQLVRNLREATSVTLPSDLSGSGHGRDHNATGQTL